MVLVTHPLCTSLRGNFAAADQTDAVDENTKEEVEEEDAPAEAAPQQVVQQGQASPTKPEAARLTNNQVQKNKGLQKQRESLKAGGSTCLSSGLHISLYSFSFFTRGCRGLYVTA